jgi:hypothetical protein
MRGGALVRVHLLQRDPLAAAGEVAPGRALVAVEGLHALLPERRPELREEIPRRFRHVGVVCEQRRRAQARDENRAPRRRVSTSRRDQLGDDLLRVRQRAVHGATVGDLRSNRFFWSSLRGPRREISRSIRSIRELGSSQFSQSLG